MQCSLIRFLGRVSGAISDLSSTVRSQARALEDDDVVGRLLDQSTEKELTTDVRVLPTVSMGKGHLTENVD